MEHFILRKKNKGQVSVEFMLLIVIVLLYIQTVIQPSLNVASSSVNDSTRVGQARFAAEKLANAVEFAQSTYGTTKQTITILIPKRATIACFDSSAPEPNNRNRFEMKVKIDSDVAICPEVIPNTDPPTYECVKSFFVLYDVDIDCSGLLTLGGTTKNVLQKVVIRRRNSEVANPRLVVEIDVE